MKVLFIYATPGYGLLNKNSRVKKRISGFFPPLGIAYLATTLEKAGHTCKVIDLQVTQMSARDILTEAKTFNPGAICFSVLTSLAPEVFQIAAILKKGLGVPIICGGQHVSLFPKETLSENPSIDYIVFGEGELKLINLINKLETNGEIKSVKGIYYRDKKNIIETESAGNILDLDKLPIPSRKFFDMKKYIPVPNQYKRQPVTNMITSRGCTYGLCKFCSESSVLHSQYRRNSVNRVIDEIKYLINEYKIKEIYFWDDEFVMDHKWVEEFCKKLKEENFDLTWSCYAKVNFVTLKLLRTMSEAGCWNIFYGIESGNQGLLNNIRKGQTLKQIKQAIKWTQEAGIEAKGSFMFGLPGETPEIGLQTIDFAIELDLDYAIFCLTTPYPGTKLYDEFLEQGGAKNIEFDKYTNLLPVYLPKGYKNRDELINLQKEAYRRFYFRWGYLKRKFKSIKSKDDIYRYLKGITFLIKMKLLNTMGM